MLPEILYISINFEIEPFLLQSFHFFYQIMIFQDAILNIMFILCTIEEKIGLR
jgi:hypothetical protein